MLRGDLLTSKWAVKFSWTKRPVKKPAVSSQQAMGVLALRIGDERMKLISISLFLGVSCDHLFSV